MKIKNRLDEKITNQCPCKLEISEKEIAKQHKKKSKRKGRMELKRRRKLKKNQKNQYNVMNKGV